MSEITDERRILGMKEIEKASEYSHAEIDPLLIQLGEKLKMFDGADFVREILKGQMLVYIGRL